RHPTIPVDAERHEVVERLWAWHRAQAVELGFSARTLCIAQQVHGAQVAVIDQPPPAPIAGVDGILTAAPGLLIGIYVADCCAVYLADPVTGACGIVHSGKKGSELGIAGVALRLMAERFGARPQDVRVQLSPCIRPPAYEIDFAAQIRATCLSAGVQPHHFADCGLCTSQDLQRYYSYRMEKGRTGRMLALLGKRA
ncbi:MAG TPA: laccase domain-containing protein, partial [Prosthecobacter sp.]|nr:laccase domain-containing protein [Prosthecobacter sp.]